MVHWIKKVQTSILQNNTHFEFGGYMAILYVLSKQSH